VRGAVLALVVRQYNTSLNTGSFGLLMCQRHLIMCHIQGNLAHKKQPPPRTLQWDFAQGPMEVLEEGAVSFERGTPVEVCSPYVESRLLRPIVGPYTLPRTSVHAP